MTPSIAVGVVGIVVSAVVALVIAAMHRKQMRQVELHRADPSVPVKPPLGPIAQFFKTSAIFLFLILSSAFMLHQDLNESSPISRHDVLDIAIHVVSMAVNLGWIVLLNAIRTLKR